MTRLPEITRADDPGPALARLRAGGPLPVLRVPLMGRVRMAVTDEAARALLKDPRIVRDVRVARGQSLDQAYWYVPKSLTPLLESLLTKDGPDHRRLRRAVEHAFSRHAIADLRPDLEARADRLLDDLTGEVDLGLAYTRALPFEAIVALLGLRPATVDALRPSISPLSEVSGPVSVFRALWHLRRVLPVLRAEIADPPEDGLLARMVAEGALSGDDLLAMLFTLFVAGHETTVHLLNNAVLTLCERPELRPALTDPRARELFVEEVMRTASPVCLTTVAYVAEDFVFDGVPLRRGDRVSALLIAANRDAARHDDPERFVPDRRPNPHLGFGHGPHVCLGMQLARLEASVGLDRLLRRFPDFRLAGPPGWTKRVGFRGPGRMTVALGRRR